MTRRHTLVLSDVHLSQAHPDDPSDPLWMRYRLRAFHPDAEFAALVDFLLAERGRHEPIELVFNGDLFDFDAPWVKDGTSSFDEFPLTDDGCADHIRRILADHDVWFRAVGRVLARGHRVLFLSGNHDLELGFPSVRAAIRDHVVGLTLEESEGPVDAAEVAERVRFRAWFHVTEDGLYLEHGSQYDVFNGVAFPMLPYTRGRDRLHPVMGKLAFKRTGSRMGYFNPYYEETFYLGLFGYAAHLWRFYVRSHRHIARTWFLGASRTVLEIWGERHAEDWSEENRTRAVEETGANEAAIDATQALRATPAERTMLPILRELWLDRLILIVAVVAMVVAAGIGFGAVGALGAGLALAVLFVVYEIATPKPDIRTYDSAPPSVLALFEIHGVRAVCMGHTHRPFGRWTDDGRFHGNSGSWCPAYRDQACTVPVLEGRPVLILTTEGDRLDAGVHWWKKDRLEPGEGASRSSDAPVLASPASANPTGERVRADAG